MNSFIRKCNNFLNNFYGVNDMVQQLNFFLIYLDISSMSIPNLRQQVAIFV